MERHSTPYARHVPKVEHEITIEQALLHKRADELEEIQDLAGTRIALVSHRTGIEARRQDFCQGILQTHFGSPTAKLHDQIRILTTGRHRTSCSFLSCLREIE